MIAAHQLNVPPLPADGPLVHCTSSSFDGQHIGRVHLIPPCIEPSESVHIQKKHRSSRRVRFSETAPTVIVSSKADSIIEELEKAWYQKEEMMRIRDDNKMCLMAYHHVGRKASLLPSDRFCIRGLESSISKSTSMLARYTRKETVTAILIAQKGFPDPNHLRMISELKSRGKVRDAIRMAVKDSKIWLEEYRSTRLP